MEPNVKYPRTPHLPYSPGVHKDDRQWSHLKFLEGKMVVVTEKVDGENTTMYPNGYHARSLSSSHHPSRDWMKRFHGSIAHHIPSGMRICGENMYALHSIPYKRLPSYFLVFNIFYEDDCLSWGDVEYYCRLITEARKEEEKAANRPWNPLNGLYHVPVLYMGLFDNVKVQACMTGQSQFGGAQEGYVVRNIQRFHYSEFKENVAKFVRERHVQTDKHWSLQAVIKNEIAPLDEDVINWYNTQ